MRVDLDFSPKDRSTVGDLVYDAIDDFFTQNMYWTKRRAPVDAAVYLRKLPIGIDRHDDPYGLIERLHGKVSNLLHEVTEFPTWHILDTTRRGEVIKIELGADFRIDDWMEKNGHEYDVGKHAW